MKKNLLDATPAEIDAGFDRFMDDYAFVLHKLKTDQIQNADGYSETPQFEVEMQIMQFITQMADTKIMQFVGPDDVHRMLTQTVKTCQTDPGDAMAGLLAHLMTHLTVGYLIGVATERTRRNE